jgi:multiple sugar transport system ATP-binding protein
MTMGTRIVVMKDGVIQQVDAPQTIYAHPVNLFVAGFIGSPQMNFIDSTVVDKDGKIYVSFEGESIPLDDEKADILKKQGYVGKEVILGIRPEDIDENPEFIAKHKDAAINVKVELTELMGAETYLYFTKGKANITARVDGSSKAQIGDTITVALESDKIHIFDKETELTVF